MRARVHRWQQDVAERIAPAEARSARRPARDSRLDLDLSWLGALRLRYANGQDTIAERGVDVPGVNVAGERHAVLEPPAPGPAAKRALALALADLAGDHELRVRGVEMDIVLLDTRKIGLDRPRVIGLLDV